MVAEGACVVRGVHGGRGVCGGRGVGACMSHDQGVCMVAGGVCGGGHVWWLGACVVGMCGGGGGGHTCWQGAMHGGGVCVWW